MSDSLITTLCDAVAARLAAQTELGSVTIVNQSDLRIIDKVQHALAGQGLVVVVLVDSVKVDAENVGEFSVGVLVTENLAQNRSASGSQLAGCECAEYIAASFLRWSPGETWSEFQRPTITQLDSGESDLQWSVDTSVRSHVYSG